MPNLKDLLNLLNTLDGERSYDLSAKPIKVAVFPNTIQSVKSIKFEDDKIILELTPKG
tara:strand:- start:699 stop:872 length:174 start_codon:yes stop_codon:yes gene_type:complete